MSLNTLIFAYIHTHTQQSGSEHSQDEGQSCEASQKLIAAAEGLLKKWESLKEIFRIPKRTPQVIKQ